MKTKLSTLLITFLLLSVTTFGQEPKVAPGQDIVGYGYNVFGKFADNESLKNYCLFDWGEPYTKAFGSHQYNIPGKVMLKNIGKKVKTEVSGADKRSYAKSFSASVGMGFDAVLFSASVNTTFSKSSSGSTAEYFHTIRDANRIWQVGIDERFEHKTMLKPKVKQDIDNMSPGKLFDIYGTHYISSAYLGGRSDYSTVTTITTSMNTQSIGAAVEASYKSISTDASTELTQQQQHIQENTRSSLTVTGGNAEFANNIHNYEAYANWAAGIRDLPVLCDFDKKSLTPIWELASTQARKNELKAYFMNVMLTNYELPPAMANLVALAGKTFLIQSKGSELFWDFKGYNTNAEGHRGKLVIWESDLVNRDRIGADRFFKIIPHRTESDYVFLQPQHVDQVVDIQGGGSKPGADAHLWHHGDNNSAQMFKMEPVEGEENTFYLQAKCSGLYLTAGENAANSSASGGGKSLNARSGSGASAPAAELKNGTQIKQQQFTGADNQKWVFVETNPRIMASPYDSNMIYSVQCVDGGKYWNFDGHANNNSNGSLLNLWDMSWGPDDRFIRIYPADNDHDYFYLQPTWTTKVIDVSLGSINNNGAKIQIWDKNSESQQLFSFEYAGAPNTWYIKNKRSGKYLDASASEVNKNGGKVQQWQFRGTNNQKWVLRSYPRIADVEKLNGTYFIKCAYSDKYWDLPGKGSETNGKGKAVKIWSLDDGADRKVKIKPTGDHDWAQIIFQNDQKAADVKSASRDKGADLHTWDQHGGESQKWGFYITGKTTFVLVNKNSRKAVDVSGGNGKINENGRIIEQWDRHNDKSQQWQLIDAQTNKPVNLFDL